MLTSEGMTYTEAIDILLKAPVKFENKVFWGMDLNSEHEKYICEKSSRRSCLYD